MSTPWTRFVLFSVFCFLLASLFATHCVAEQRVANEFRLIKITRTLISPPQFAYTGAQQYPTNQRDRWLEVEVEFVAPETSDDLVVRYFALINGTVLTGEVTHTCILAGRESRSVMYLSPAALARFTGGRITTTNVLENVAVQLLQNGTVKSELNMVNAPRQWFAGLPHIGGLLLNKSQTPFASLYWDRYAQIKAPP